MNPRPNDKWMDERRNPSYVTVTQRQARQIVSCESCKGTGYGAMSSWHNGKGALEISTRTNSKGDDKQYQHPCSSCKGHGRVVKITNSYSTAAQYVDTTDLTTMDRAIKEGYNLFHDEEREYTFRLCRDDSEMNNKHPELAAINYDEYDKMLEDFKVQDKLIRASDD